jgi:hypothetical protein
MFTLCLEPGGPCVKNCERAPDRQSSQQVFGSSLITLSTILGLAPALVTLIYPQALSTQNLMANRTAWNTILFVLSCIPGAISQMYKERALMAFAQPVDSNFLNALLSLFSFGFILAVCPLVYGLQGLADTPTQPDTVTGINYENWAHLYPSKRISDNFSDGLKCVVGLLDDETQRNGYPGESVSALVPCTPIIQRYFSSKYVSTSIGRDLLQRKHTVILLGESFSFMFFP